MDQQPTNVAPAPEPQVPAPQEPTPTTPEPTPAPGTKDPGQGLAIAGIILAFFIPLIGLVLSIVGRSKTKKAGLKTSMSTVGIALNAVFLALGLIVFTLFVVGFIGIGKATLDNEAKTDVDSLSVSINEYYDTYGYYPNSLSDLTDADPYAIEPPNSNYVYSYVPLPIGCNDTCNSYTLSVQLSDDSIYSADSGL